MPWHIEKQKDKYCVVKDSNNKSVGCHKTRKEAVDHLAALNINVKDAKSALSSVPDRWGRKK